MKITLGTTVRDKITGLEGITTGRCEYISGCVQLLVQPMIDRDGKYVENRWFDEDRLAVLDRPKVTLAIENAGFDTPAPSR